MHVRSLRGKRGRSSDPGTDRAVRAAVVLAVTVVFLLVGFSGPSDEFVLPGLAGWIYIGVVIVVATALLVRIIRVDANRAASRMKAYNRSQNTRLDPILPRK
jgi:protein-S-isoprenylcysteine O-methyltransferase Ste14